MTEMKELADYEPARVKAMFTDVFEQAAEISKPRKDDDQYEYSTEISIEDEEDDKWKEEIIRIVNESKKRHLQEKT